MASTVDMNESSPAHDAIARIRRMLERLGKPAETGDIATTLDEVEQEVTIMVRENAALRAAALAVKEAEVSTATTTVSQAPATGPAAEGVILPALAAPMPPQAPSSPRPGGVASTPAPKRPRRERRPAQLPDYVYVSSSLSSAAAAGIGLAELRSVGGGSAGAGGGRGLSPALMDRFAAHIVGRDKKVRTAIDYRTMADEFVAAWLRPLGAGPIADEEEFRRFYRQHRESFVARFKAGKGLTGSDRGRRSAVRHLMQFMGLAENESLFWSYGCVPPSSPQHAGSNAPKGARGGTLDREKEDGQVLVMVIEPEWVRIHVGAPLSCRLRRAFVRWLIDGRVCTQGGEAEAHMEVLQRLFRQVLAVREYKHWQVGLRAAEAAGYPALAKGAGGRWADLRVAGGSLVDKAAVRAVVAEANLLDVVRDDGAVEEKVAMELLARWLASAETGSDDDDEEDGGGAVV